MFSPKRQLRICLETLQARRVPIEGAAGVGYVLRHGFDLPPLMFTTEDIEAIAVAMRMLRRTGDVGLQAAAETVLSKVTVALPDALRAHLTEPPVFVSRHGAPTPLVADLAAIRAAIRGERKLRVAYGDEKGACTERTIWPFAIAYFAEAGQRLVRAARRFSPFPCRSDFALRHAQRKLSGLRKNAVRPLA